MKRSFVFICLLFMACSSPKKEFSRAENSFDAGREFIDACLKGDFEKAGFYLLKDSLNIKYLEDIENTYRKNDREGRKQLREASINIREVDDVTPYISIINYNNSFDTTAHKVKVIKQGMEWLVDLKYTYNPNL